MNKKFNLGLVAFLVGSSALAVSCGKAHEHVWDNGVTTTSATCTVAGVKTFTCECGETMTKEIAALGHDHSKTVIDQVKSEINTECSRCDDVKETVKYYTVEAAREHMKSADWTKFDEMTVLGFVKKVTYTQYESYNIDLYMGVDSFQLYSAQLVEGLSAPEVGDLVVCTGLTQIYKETTFEVAYDSTNKVSPSIWYKETLTWGEEKVTTPATCTATGVKSASTTDGKWTRNDVVAKLEHDLDKGTVTTEPTCFEKGVKTFSCKDCDYTKTEDVEALGKTSALADLFTYNSEGASKTETGVKLTSLVEGEGEDATITYNGASTYFGAQDKNTPWDGTNKAISFDLDLSAMEANDFTAFSLAFNNASLENATEFMVGFAYDGEKLYAANLASPAWDATDYDVIKDGERGFVQEVADVDLSKVSVKMSFGYDDDTNELLTAFAVNNVKHILSNSEFGPGHGFKPVGLRALWNVVNSGFDVIMTNLQYATADSLKAGDNEDVKTAVFTYLEETSYTTKNSGEDITSLLTTNTDVSCVTTYTASQTALYKNSIRSYSSKDKVSALTLTAKEGMKIYSVAVVYDTSKTGGFCTINNVAQEAIAANHTSDTVDFSEGVSSVELLNNSGNQVRYVSITVTYK